jgi:O-antigen ligase
MRDTLFFAASDLAQDGWFLGYGYTYYSLLGRAVFGHPVAIDAHNAHFQIILSLGIVGYIAWLWVIVAVGRRLWEHKNQGVARLFFVILLFCLPYSMTSGLASNVFFWTFLAVAGQVHVLERARRRS